MLGLLLLACATAPEPADAVDPVEEPVVDARDAYEALLDEDTGHTDPALLDLFGRVLPAEVHAGVDELLLYRDFDGDGLQDSLQFASLEPLRQMARLTPGDPSRREVRFVVTLEPDGDGFTLVFHRLRLEDLRSLRSFS